jgi:VanZ family protein
MPTLGPLQIGRRAGTIWLLVLLWTTAVLWAGGEHGSAAATSHFLWPILRWLLPDASWATLLQIHFYIRKGAHVAEFGVLALLTLSALRASVRAAVLRLGLLALVWVLAIAACDEARQALSTARTGSAWDVALDVTGGILALTLAIAYTRVMHPRRTPPAPG